MTTPPAGVRIDPASLPADSNPNRLTAALAGDAEHLARGAEIERLREALRQADLRADLLRAQVADLTAERDAAVDEQERRSAEVAQLVGVLEEVAIAHRGDADGTADATAWLENLPDEITEARREADEHAERLRGMLAEALDGWLEAGGEAHAANPCPHPGGAEVCYPRIAEIRRGAGLS